MPTLTDKDRLFVEQRRARRHIGLYVLPGLIVLLGLVWAALFLWWPLAVNPMAVVGATEMGTLNCGTGALSTYAVSATVLVNALLLLFALVAVAGIALYGRERHYLRIIDKLGRDQALAPPRVPAEARAVRQ